MPIFRRGLDWLRLHHHEADHVFYRNLVTATDTEIWECGKSDNLVIFSKDVDFYDRALLFDSSVSASQTIEWLDSQRSALGNKARHIDTIAA